MKKISLQWKLTLLTTVLITILCGCLTLFLYKNGIYCFDTLQESVTDQGTLPEAVYIDIPDDEWDDFVAQFSLKVYDSKSDYRTRSLLITAVVALLGGAATYFISGRALKPLREFSETVEKVQAQNLTDYTIEENKIAELDRLRISYNKMLMRLSESFETQRQFTGNAAHELRTPLALIQAQLDLYHTTEHPESTTTAEETIQMITEQNERLSKLVRTLLDMSELQTVARNDRIEIHSLIEEVLADLEPLAQEKKIELIQKSQGAGEKADEELFLTGSDILIYRMLYNLLSGGDTVYHMLSMIIGQFEIILSVKELREKSMSNSQIHKALKIHEYRIKKAVPLADRYSIKDLRRILINAYEIDNSIKSGLMEAQLALELFIAEI